MPGDYGSSAFENALATGMQLGMRSKERQVKAAQELQDKRDSYAIQGIDYDKMQKDEVYRSQIMARPEKAQAAAKAEELAKQGIAPTEQHPYEVMAGRASAKQESDLELSMAKAKEAGAGASAATARGGLYEQQAALDKEKRLHPERFASRTGMDHAEAQTAAGRLKRYAVLTAPGTDPNTLSAEDKAFVKAYNKHLQTGEEFQYQEPAKEPPAGPGAFSRAASAVGNALMPWRSPQDATEARMAGGKSDSRPIITAKRKDGSTVRGYKNPDGSLEVIP